MKITIAERFHPFSHQLGTKLLLPGSSLTVAAYPTHLEFSDLEMLHPSFHIDFSFLGPIQDFTAEMDLELGRIRVFGTTEHGYFCYSLHAQADGVLLKMEKIGGKNVECRHSFSPHLFSLTKGTELLIPMPLHEQIAPSVERLSLGMHKSQEWDGVVRRLDFKEIFPVWHRICAWMSLNDFNSQDGNFELLEKCRKTIEDREKESILLAFKNFFLASFEGILVPRSFDTQYQGILSQISLDKSKLSFPSLALLVEGGKLVRSLFFQEKRNEILIMPCVPSQFHCGRMTNVFTSHGNVIDFEWSKKSLRRLRIVASVDGEVVLKLPKVIASCRIKVGRKTITHPSVDAEGILKLTMHARDVVHLDRFYK